MTYVPVYCQICKELLGSAHRQGHAELLRRHVHQAHPDVAAEASRIENEIRTFRSRYGRNILRVL